jgi:thiamine-monophosphate kinase
MAAASDVAAMGATPWCALAAMVVPGDVDDAALEAVASGQREAAEAAGAPVVGGNLARGPAMSIATTLLGTCERPVERRGARAGDGLWMAGRVGLAAAGLRALEEGKAGEARLAAAIAAWRVPRALFAEGRAMAGKAHAAVDVSDGLARDAGHLAEASGVQVILDEAALLEDAVLLEAAATLGASALDLALHGGEDYALVAAGEQSIEGFRRIGEVRAGRGLVLRGVTGERSIEPRGFDHFRR